MSRFKNHIKVLLGALLESKPLLYSFVVVLGVLLVGFVDENSLWSHYCNKQKILDLQEEINKYDSSYRHDMKVLKALDNNPKELERVAREKYFMKSDDEDIYVLSTDEVKQQEQP